MEMLNFRSGFVAVLGRPNVGKSTLINQLIGEKVLAVSPKAQTTRRRVRGILNEENLQMIFIDTPGVHIPPKNRKLNIICVEEAVAALEDADLLIYMIDITRPFQQQVGSDEAFLLNVLKKAAKKHSIPVLVVLNKIDSTNNKNMISQHDVNAVLEGISVPLVLPISAKSKEGLDILLAKLRTLLPEHPAYFPTDISTDETVRALAGEFIQEQLFYFLGEEVPYSCAVEIVQYKEPSGSMKMVEIDAAIYVERDSQKGLVVGAGGKKIKEIGQAARQRLEDFLQQKVILRLHVKHFPHWTKDFKRLKKLGYILPEKNNEQL